MTLPAMAINNLFPKDPDTLARTLARGSPMGLALYASGGAWKALPHLRVFNRELMDLVAGKYKILCLSVPPRHGKSEFISKYFPAWFLARFPDKKVILSSYQDAFSSQWGGRARDVFKEYAGPLFGVRLDKERQAASSWSVAGHGGVMNTAGFEGAVTGKGAHAFIVDDPFKDPEEANSALIREKKWDWFQSVAMTRLEPGGFIVVIQTRWHEEDIIGKIQRDWIRHDRSGPYASQAKSINFPALAEEDDELGREVGDPLWPTFMSVDDWHRVRSATSSYFWSAIYQGHPQPPGGGAFRRENFLYFREEKDHFELLQPDGTARRVLRNRCKWFQTCDTAMKTGQHNDYTVILTVVLTPDKDLLIYDSFKTRVEVPKQYALIRAQRERYKDRLVFQAVEDKQSGTGLIQQARNDGQPFKILKADRDKQTRAVPASIMYENHMIYHRVGAPWLSDFEDELLAFPRGAHDDQVDVVAYAAIIVGKITNGPRVTVV